MFFNKKRIFILKIIYDIGYLADKIGDRKVVFIASIVVTLGWIVIYIGIMQI